MATTEQIAEFVALTRELGLAEIDLDELVHDTFGAGACDALNQEPDEAAQEFILDSASRDASEINNSGLERQIAFLVDEIGPRALTEALEELAA